MRAKVEEKKMLSKKEEMWQVARKKLAQMNLLDDFLFGSMVAYPEIGEQFVRILLRTIFSREFKHLSVVAQKVFYGADVDLRGARLDVYTEPEVEEGLGEQATAYDIEPDRKDSSEDRRFLPRRVRFYHVKVTAKNIRSGCNYGELKNVIIIMILPFDPFGLGRMMYTVKNMCVEVPSMPYEDGASTLFLYTKGTEGVPNDAVKQLLHYLENTTYENAVNEELREIHKMVQTVKGDSETMLAHLRMMEDLDRSRQEGLAEGDMKRLVSLICKKIKKNKTPEEIAADLEEELTVIEPIYNVVQEFAPEYDLEAVIRKLGVGKQE